VGAVLLIDGELFAHLPGAVGLRVVDGELYGVLGKKAGTAYTLTVTDNLTFADSLGREAGKTLSDSLNLSDTYDRLFGKTLSDSLALSDPIAKSILREIVDSLSLSDFSEAK